MLRAWLNCTIARSASTALAPPAFRALLIVSLISRAFFWLSPISFKDWFRFIKRFEMVSELE